MRLHGLALAGALSCAAVLCATVPYAVAEPDDDRAEPGTGGRVESAASAPRPAHWLVAIGGFAAVTGPAGSGGAAMAEIYPGGVMRRFGTGIYYRAAPALERGMLTAGIGFEPGASRPTLVLTFRAEAGWERSLGVPVLGAGSRTQLAFFPPLAICMDVTGHLLLDGLDTRLALALTVSAGIAR